MFSSKSIVRLLMYIIMNSAPIASEMMENYLMKYKTDLMQYLVAKQTIYIFITDASLRS